jgi:glycosyltransferase involved in cell wall biosynthesis
MLADLYAPIIGGGERHIQSLSRHLAQNGHKVTICTMSIPGSPRYEEDCDIKIYRLVGAYQKIPCLFKDPARKWHPPVSDPVVRRQIRQIISREKPDIIHAHGRIVYSVLGLKNKLDIPLVVTLHTYWAVCPTTNLMYGNTICSNPLNVRCVFCGRQFYGLTKSFFAYVGTRINKHELESVDKFIAVSSFVKNVHAKCLGVAERNIEVIPNFYAHDNITDTGGYDDLPQKFVLFVGSLIPNKGVGLLVEAYQKIRAQTKLVLIGASHPSYRYQGTDDILVKENAPYNLVLEAYQKCHFAAFPSIWPEPFGIVVLEAMSQKKAVIATNIGGFTDSIVDGKTGILVPPNDVGALATAISYLLENPNVVEEMGQAGYKRWKENFTPEVVVPKIEELYHSIK